MSNNHNQPTVSRRPQLRGAAMGHPHLIGYSDRFSVAPGEKLDFMVSTTEDRYDIDLVRISRAEDHHGAPGVREERVPGALSGTVAGGQQTSSPGSYVYVPGVGDDLRDLAAWCLDLWVLPTLLERSAEQVLVSTVSAVAGIGWELLIDRDARVVLRLQGDRGVAMVKSRDPLRSGHWYEIVAGHDDDVGEAVLAVRESSRSERIVDTCAALPGEFGMMASGLMIAARDRTIQGLPRTKIEAHFDGRIEELRIAACAPPALLAGNSSADTTRDVVARWDFGHDPSGTCIRDCGSRGWHGIAVNQPARAVTGHRWSGDEHDYRRAPEQYSAIHFHNDDLGQVGWDVSFTLPVSEDLKSGVYAVRCAANGLVDHIPFAVIPAPSEPRASVAVILPSYTYLAYANMRQGLEIDFQERKTVGREVTHDPSLDLLREHPEWGMSLYDIHSDGSGCMYASWQRPLLNMRPGYTNWVTGGPREFSADLCLIHWLARQGIEVDVLTDAELHEHGVAALAPYRVVMTGSHPEYATGRMVEALDEYVNEGGRLMYLGGNGFYWVASVAPAHPDVIEVRRGHSGTRSWTSRPGELHHSTTGERGGLWRYRGRTPNDLVGVGFTGQGWDVRAGYYQRLPPSTNPDYSWIFDGVDDCEPIGDFGLVMNGAAGDEIDRHDPALGGDTATVIARSAGHSDHYCVAVEELLQATPDVTASTNELVRADMVYWTKGRGIVFSVGSMNWIPALPVNDCQNNVSRITANVLRRFGQLSEPAGRCGSDSLEQLTQANGENSVDFRNACIGE